MTLGWIVAASVAGGTLSAGLAAGSLYLRASWIPMLVSFAIGALLGAAFLEIIPAAFAKGQTHQAASAILGGIFAFFVLEKLLLYRHCHTENCEVHDQHDHGRSGALIVVGDTVHNFLDGVLIAAAFLQSTELGVIAAIAIIAHEIPQEVGDFAILLHAGYSRSRALLLNVLSAASSAVGAVAAFFAFDSVPRLLPYFLALAAASFLYVAMADLIPGLHRGRTDASSMRQILLIGAGIATMLVL